MSMREWAARNRPVIERVLRAVGYEPTQWGRVVMYDRCGALLRSLNPPALDALEISSGHCWQRFGFGSLTEANYPEFDVCAQTLARQFDIIIADQVFEHLLWPRRAVGNVLAMLKPGGHFLVTTPFLIKVHRVPEDCSRWTETGLKYLLHEGGFPLENIQTGSWGNRACVKANLVRWVRRGWGRSLRNEPEFPLVVWALARKGSGPVAPQAGA